MWPLTPALRLSQQQAYEALEILSDGRLNELRCAVDACGKAVTPVVSVSAVARRIREGHLAARTAPANASVAGSVFDEVVLRATTGP